MVNVRAAVPFDVGLTGVTVIWGVAINDHEFSVATEASTFGSMILSVQVPSIDRPFRELRLPAGLYVRLNGATPEAIGIVALSSRMVLVKFVLLPPVPPALRMSGMIVVPSGATRKTWRSESLVELMLSWTARWAILKLLSGKFGMTSDELRTVPAPWGTCGVILSDQA